MGPLPFANMQVGRYKLCLRRTDHGKFELDVFDSSVRISLDLLVRRGIANLCLSLQWSAIAEVSGPGPGLEPPMGLGLYQDRRGGDHREPVLTPLRALNEN